MPKAVTYGYAYYIHIRQKQIHLTKTNLTSCVLYSHFTGSVGQLVASQIEELNFSKKK